MGKDVKLVFLGFVGGSPVYREFARHSERNLVTDRLHIWVEEYGRKNTLRSRVAILDYTGKHEVHAHFRKLEYELAEELKIHMALGV